MRRAVVTVGAALALLGPLAPVPPTALAVPSAADQLANLPVPVVDVTHSDRSLRDIRREVVVLTPGRSGRPELRKLRTRTVGDARRLIAALNRRPGVTATANSRLRANATALESEPEGSAQGDLLMIGAPTAWETTTGAGVTVAVIDTGVDSVNPDLAGRVLPELDLLPEIDPIPDGNGHGTLVASIIAAGLNSYGVAGVAPDANILPVAALDYEGYGDVATVAKAIVAATDAGARVINLSLGGPDRDRVLDAACAYAHAKGAVLVAAAGNSRLERNETTYPAASPFVLAVGSVGADGAPSSFSNTGKYLDIAAPGEDIIGAAPGEGQNVMDGTSAAAPHVSGVIALAAAANPQLSSDELVQLVLGTAMDDPSGNGWDNRFGHGVVRADLAVASALAAVPPAAATELRQVTGVDVAPEPVRRKRPLYVIVSVTRLYADGAWRADPGGTDVVVEFKAAGKRKYTQQAVARTAPGGYAAIGLTAKKSGRWRARVIMPDGSVAVGPTDYVKVR